MVPFSSVLRSIVTTGVKSRPLRFEIDRRLISRTGQSLLLLHIPSPATPFWVRLAMSLTGPGELRYFLLQRRQRDSTATSPKDLSSIDDESLPEISWTDAVPQQEQQDTALGGPVKSAPDQTATTTAMVDYQISRSTDLQGITQTSWFHARIQCQCIPLMRTTCNFSRISTQPWWWTSFRKP